MVMKITEHTLPEDFTPADFVNMKQSVRDGDNPMTIIYNNNTDRLLVGQQYGYRRYEAGDIVRGCTEYVKEDGDTIYLRDVLPDFAVLIIQ
jgi:hypothetical protein